MNYINGDLLKLFKDKHFDVLIHGCNCFCTMGKGLAEKIKNEYPEAYKIDCLTKKGDKYKLGTYSIYNIKETNQIIVNAYTQFHWLYNVYGKNEILVDYEALDKIFSKIKIEFTDKKICIPKIGAGLAKGDWLVIESIIDKHLYELDCTCVLYE